jgi:hypothetical protein
MIVGKSVGGIKGYEKKSLHKKWLDFGRKSGWLEILQSSDEYI